MRRVISAYTLTTTVNQVIRNLLLSRVLLITSLVMCSCMVNAALIDNGDTTTDTDTGLIWLDLTETIGLSVHDFLADTGGYLSSGWSLALGSQVDTLFVNAGAPDPSDAAVIDLLLSLLGQTGENDGAFGQGFADNGSGTFSLPLYWAWNNRPAINGSENCCYPPERAEVWLGLYLVMPTVIPLPAAVWLFGSGLIGLIGLARRKKA